MKFKLAGLPSKIARHADKFGYLYAAVGTDKFGFNRMDAIISSVQQLMVGVIHMPDLQVLINNFAKIEGMEALWIWLAGMGVEMINPPIIGKFGPAIQKGAVAYAIGAFAVRAFYGATHSELKGINIETHPVSETARGNFERAPTMKQLAGRGYY